jgi:glycosyltransferase involved in cell wall biosynthesis
MGSCLTVIIPVLNAMPYLPEALASLETQNFKDFEVCLWDNGSTDGSVEEAKRWIPHRLPGRVVSGNPLPLHECLARMVEEAKTKFVARMDGDDVCVPERFKQQVVALQENPKLAAVGGQVDLIDELGKRIGEISNYPVQHLASICRLLIQSPMPHPAVMMRRDMALSAGNYSRPKPMEDFDLWFRLARVGLLENLPGKLLKYRIANTSITNQSKKHGCHLEEMRLCLKANCPTAFGISEGVFDLLWCKKHPAAFLPMRRAAKSIAKLSGVGMQSVLGCPEFLFSARCYTAKWDVCSKVVYRFWGRNV